VIKTDRPISRLGESISLNGTRRDAATGRRGRSCHPNVLDLLRQNVRDKNNRGKIKKNRFYGQHQGFQRVRKKPTVP
jgi:hypothetical protein